MTFNANNYNLPNHMADGLNRYINHGISGGSFMTAVLENNLVQAFNRADEFNTVCMREWANVLYNYLPRNAWGNPEAVRLWIASGGLEGQQSDTEVE